MLVAFGDAPILQSIAKFVNCFWVLGYQGAEPPKRIIYKDQGARRNKGMGQDFVLVTS